MPIGLPKLKHAWFRQYLPGTPKELKPFRRSELAMFPRLEFYKWESITRLTPYNAWTYFMTGWIFTNLAIAYYNSGPNKYMNSDSVFVDQMTPAERIEANRMKDPNRMPWPVLHKYVTEMREGKRNLDDMGKLWKQTLHYYPHDWLIPIEFTQILKYSTAKLLSQYVEDPEAMRKQMLFQLINVRYDRVKFNEKVSQDVKEIIAVACDDLTALDFSDMTSVPLVPTHTVRASGESDRVFGR